MKNLPKLLILIVVFLAGCATVGGNGPLPPAPVGEDLFSDGSAVVELAHPIDGDTAAFLVDGVEYNTRFLAVDTPEVSHPTIGVEPWGVAAKEFTADLLLNADQIVLELDAESDIFDHYDRLLAWVWVDGELLNYRLIEEGYALVMYLYGDYKYNSILLQKELEVRQTKVRVHGEKDPDYDYEKKVVEHSIETVRNEKLGTRVQVDGVVTSKIGNNAFIQSGDFGIYIYAGSNRWEHLAPGNHVDVVGMLADYNGLLEISSIKSVDLLGEGAELPESLEIELGEIGEEQEGRFVSVGPIEIKAVQPHSGRGYNVEISDASSEGIIRIDKYLVPYIEPEVFEAGDSYVIRAAVGQYRDQYQLMLARIEDLVPATE